MTEANATTKPIVNTVELSRSLGQQRAETLVAIFKPLWEKAQESVEVSAKINVTDATQKREMAAARTQRLALRAIRLEADKHRRAEKESAQREATAIQTIYNAIENIIEPEETRLEQCEKFAEIEEARRRSQTKLQRQSELACQGFLSPAGIVLEDLEPAEWDNLLTRAKHEKAERERKANEAAEQARKDAAERDRLRAEKAEADKKAADAERAAKAAREETARIQAEAERKEREAKLQAERAAKAAADKAKEEAAEKERLRRAAEAAPDCEKLRAFAKIIDDLWPGEASTEQGKAVFAALGSSLTKLRYWCMTKANELEGGQT